MAAWRRLALRLFRELRRDFVQPDYSVYMLFFDLLPVLRAAHEDGEFDILRKIYGFSEWCFGQKTGDLMNAAGVAFYEHLFDEKRLWAKVVPWLSPRVIGECRALWKFRLPPEDFDAIEKLIAGRRERLYEEAWSAISGPTENPGDRRQRATGNASGG